MFRWHFAVNLQNCSVNAKCPPTHRAEALWQAERPQQMVTEREREMARLVDIHPGLVSDLQINIFLKILFNLLGSNFATSLPALISCFLFVALSFLQAGWHALPLTTHSWNIPLHLFFLSPWHTLSLFSHLLSIRGVALLSISCTCQSFNCKTIQ